MRIVILANNILKEELLKQRVNNPLEIRWLAGIDELDTQPETDACIDLLFEPAAKRIELLKKRLPGLVLVNSVTTTLQELPEGFIRFNGWPTFLERPVVESSGTDDSLKKKCEDIFLKFNKRVEWVDDKPGFISVRIIAMIINEAYFALEEGVSSKNEINTSMKLGTNYPYGPFEWAEKIGKEKIVSLLNQLYKSDKRFEPAHCLQNEIIQ